MYSSNRLNYRRLMDADFDLYYEVFSSKEVMKYAYMDAFASMEEARAEFQRMIALQQDDKEATQFVVSLKDSNSDIGIVDYEVLLKNNAGGIFEIGYFIKPIYWGYGYASEMGKAIIGYIFTNYNVHKIAASCNANNEKSENIMKKLGMQKEGIFKESRYKNERWEDEIRYSLLREDWVKLK